jgi:hypothetical protein
MLFLFLWACLSEPQYTLPELKSQKSPSLLGDDPPPEPGNDGMIEENIPPPNDEFSDNGGLCRPVSSSMKRFPAVSETGIEVSTDISIKEGSGALLVEVVRQDPEKGSVVVYNISCNRASSLKFFIPKNIGSVYAVYFADKGGDGPTEDDLVGVSDLMDTTQEDSFSHSIFLEKGNSIAPLQLPFFPIAEEKNELAPPPPSGSDNLSPPINEPEEGLPDPIQDSGAAPKEVPNIEEVVGESDDQVEELPPKE